MSEDERKRFRFVRYCNQCVISQGRGCGFAGRGYWESRPKPAWRQASRSSPFSFTVSISMYMSEGGRPPSSEPAKVQFLRLLVKGRLVRSARLFVLSVRPSAAWRSSAIDDDAADLLGSVFGITYNLERWLLMPIRFVYHDGSGLQRRIPV